MKEISEILAKFSPKLASKENIRVQSILDETLQLSRDFDFLLTCFPNPQTYKSMEKATRDLIEDDISYWTKKYNSRLENLKIICTYFSESVKTGEVKNHTDLSTVHHIKYVNCELEELSRIYTRYMQHCSGIEDTLLTKLKKLTQKHKKALDTVDFIITEYNETCKDVLPSLTKFLYNI